MIGPRQQEIARGGALAGPVSHISRGSRGNCQRFGRPLPAHLRVVPRCAKARCRFECHRSAHCRAPTPAAQGTPCAAGCRAPPGDSKQGVWFWVVLVWGRSRHAVRSGLPCSTRGLKAGCLVLGGFGVGAKAGGESRGRKQGVWFWVVLVRVAREDRADWSRFLLALLVSLEVDVDS